MRQRLKLEAYGVRIGHFWGELRPLKNMNIEKPNQMTFLQTVYDLSRSYILKKIFKRFTSRIRKNKPNVRTWHNFFSKYSYKFARHSLLDINWLDQNRKNFVIELCPAYESLSYGPKLNEGDETICHVTIPAIKQYFFDNARINISSSSVVCGTEAIIE